MYVSTYIVISEVRHFHFSVIEAGQGAAVNCTNYKKLFLIVLPFIEHLPCEAHERPHGGLLVSLSVEVFLYCYLTGKFFLTG